MKVDAEKIEALAGQLARDEMLELVDVEVRPEGARAGIRVVLDRQGGIRLGEIESFSRRFGALLEVEDPVQGPYVLEVSSPGLDRKLTRPAHFAACRGKRIRVSLSDFVEGSRNFRGILTDSDEDGFGLERDGKRYRIPYRLVRKANLEVTQEELFGTGKRKR
ncbi:MAG: ribosome maturation factor RimP [Deltaproteobacteria bacterium]